MVVKRNYEQAFREAIPESFSELIKSYGFSISKLSDWQFEFRSGVCVIRVEMDRKQVFIDIKPVDVKQVINPDFFIGFDLGEIINCLNPEVGFKYRSNLVPEDITDESKRLLKLLLQYCEPMLRGNFNLWPQLRICRDKQWKKYE